jgi:hypothetical protein
MQGRGNKYVENFSRKHEGKRSLRRPSHGWENNIKMHLKITGYDGVDRIQLAQDRD